MRLFAAAAVCPEIRGGLARAQKELARETDAVRWVSPAGFHVTLRFFGDVPDAAAQPLGDLLARAVRDAAACSVVVAGVGVFPDVAHPAVVWAGITDGQQALARTARLVEHAAVAAGYVGCERPFAGHVTLGRVRAGGSTEGLARGLSRYRDTVFGRNDVRAVLLMRSHLRPQGPVYEIVRSIPLA